MTSFTSLALTILLRGWRQRKQPFKKHFAFVQMPVKRTSRGQYHLYNGYLDYDGALAELEVARRSLPNDSRIFAVMGYIQRRQGRWEESIRNLERAIELDPRNVNTLRQDRT